MSLRLAPARIADVVDGRRLRVNLTAAALDLLGDEDSLRRSALKLLHGALFRGRMIAKERLEAGASGLETARLLATVADETIAALYDFATVHMFRARNPTQGERFAVVAVGGYGRGELAPSSDVDLLFLRSYKPTPFAESVTEYMLYMLWDMALKVGHASRSLDETLRLARDDHTIQTALLEARHIAGDETLTSELKARFRTEVAEPGHRAFVQAKLKERDARHARAGASPYLVEPNVKESVGGLRDLQLLFWLLKHKTGLERIEDFVATGALTPKEAASCRVSADFLWRVRSHLHFLAGRAEERLTFDVQPELAQRLGFKERAGAPAVERFMKRYFLAATAVASVSRILAAKIEADQPRGRLASILPKRRVEISSAFALDEQRLALAAPDAFKADPVNLLRLFEIADALHVEPHPEALAAARRSLNLIGPRMRADPEASRAFLAVAASPHNPARTLRLMSETGVLGRYLPEFGRIVAQMQFNMYHHYTVDEHTLRAVDIISRIEKSELREDHPLATSILPKIVNRRALYLSMLLHDTGKGQGDQCVLGEIAARAACERLGLPEEEVDLVAWLVRHHLVMSEVAQKRDLSDPATIAAFANTVGSLERLRLLLVLTVADIRAVGPGVWNGWKGQLLRDLYALTEAVFLGGRTDEEAVRERLAARAAAARADAIAALGPALVGREALLEALDDAYFLSFSQTDIAWHLEALGPPDETAARVCARSAAAKGVTEVLVVARDRPGLFARLAEAFAATGADVRDARVHTTANGLALDVFSVQNQSGEPFGRDNSGALQRLLERLTAAASGAGAPSGERARPGRRGSALRVRPWVRIDNELSSDATVVEVSGRDRPGLLADLARTMAEAGLSLASAHIDAVGERAEDVFYLTEFTGEKLRDLARMEALEGRLLAVLQQGEPDAPETLAREPMATAPASDAR